MEKEIHDHSYMHAHGLSHSHGHVHENQKAVGRFMTGTLERWRRK